MANRHQNFAPSHPGELLREIVIPGTGLTRKDIAIGLGLSRQTLYDILNEKQPVSSATALRLGRYFGNGAELWLDMQKSYDLWITEKLLLPELNRIIPLKAA
jgi:antitoxin HigA-1